MVVVVGGEKAANVTMMVWRERRMVGQEDVRVTEGKGRLEIRTKTVPVGVRVRVRVSLDPPSPLALLIAGACLFQRCYTRKRSDSQRGAKYSSIVGGWPVYVGTGMPNVLLTRPRVGDAYVALATRGRGPTSCSPDDDAAAP